MGPLKLRLKDIYGSLERHSRHLPVEFSVNIWSIIVSVYISLCLTNEKSKFPPRVLIFLFLFLFLDSYNCDPDQWKKGGHFRALLTNFPSGFPVFRLTVRYDFPKDRPRWGTDPIFMKVTSSLTQGRLGAPTAAVYAEENIMQFKQGAGIEAMQHHWQQKKKKLLPDSQVTWGVCAETNGEQGCRTMFSGRIW